MAMRFCGLLVLISFVFFSSYTPLHSQGNTQGVDEAATRKQGVGYGALLGAGLGCAAGMLLDKKYVATATAIGTTIGGAAGWVYADHVVSEKKKILAENRSIERLRDDIKRSNKKLQQSIERTQNLIARYKQNKAKLASEHANQKRILGLLEKDAKRIDDAILDSNKLLATLEAEESVYSDAVINMPNPKNIPPADPVDRNINSFRNDIERLRIEYKNEKI